MPPSSARCERVLALGTTSNKAPKRTTRCALYTRSAVSSPEAIRRQRRRCLDLIDKRTEDYRVATSRYSDDGYRGNTLWRPGLWRLIRDVRKGKVDCVVADHASRLTRNIRHHIELQGLLAGMGVELLVVDVPRNATPELLLAVLESFAEFERDQIEIRSLESRGVANG
jgi:DNA invertase Pin-like site-specific DNA recombinase